MLEHDSHEHNLLARASLDHCVKCTVCETQCPVAAVTPLFSGPKYVGPQAERYRHGESVDQSLDYCSSCGICTLVCPQGVKIAELNSVARAAMKAKKMPLRDRLISRTTLMGQAMTPVAPLANAVLKLRPARVVIEKTIGIHRDAAMPTAHSRTLTGWLRSRPKPTRGQIVFFHGCAATYFEIETAIQTIEVLEALGYEVIVPKQGCCGLPLQSNGIFDTARAWVRKLVAQLNQAPRDLPMVSCSTSCAGMLKHEAREILGVKDPELAEVGGRIRDICELLLQLYDEGELDTSGWRPNPIRLPYHAPCQLRGHGIGTPAVDLMRLIPELEVVESGAYCCGIAGTYGLKKEKYEVAMAVGKPVFDKVLETGSSLAACDSETCRWQIEHATQVPTVHPIALVHQAMGLS
ncbi:MAG: anaerobic glycerol-3-phosphate dehydrogenase subunit C [Actinomycetia bacterium]|nr:anaerobic glycerol-3-phosphate dehydrogenase subunit C [Actinomycetes bacterium]